MNHRWNGGWWWWLANSIISHLAFFRTDLCWLLHTFLAWSSITNYDFFSFSVSLSLFFSLSTTLVLCACSWLSVRALVYAHSIWSGTSRQITMLYGRRIVCVCCVCVVFCCCCCFGPVSLAARWPLPAIIPKLEHLLAGGKHTSVCGMHKCTTGTLSRWPYTLYIKHELHALCINHINKNNICTKSFNAIALMSPPADEALRMDECWAFSNNLQIWPDECKRIWTRANGETIAQWTTTQTKTKKWKNKTKTSTATTTTTTKTTKAHVCWVKGVIAGVEASQFDCMAHGGWKECQI